jgi:hypothetical protein
MAMGAVQSITATGASANLQTPTATETVLPYDDLILHVANASGSAITVTLVDPGFTPAGSAATNATVSIPATTGRKFIAISTGLMNSTTGLISVQFSATTSVTAEWLVR